MDIGNNTYIFSCFPRASGKKKLISLVLRVSYKNNNNNSSGPSTGI